LTGIDTRCVMGCTPCLPTYTWYADGTACIISYFVITTRSQLSYTRCTVHQWSLIN